MQMLESKDANNSQNQSYTQGDQSTTQNYQQHPATAYQPQQMQQPQNDQNLFDDPNDEEIPFWSANVEKMVFTNFMANGGVRNA